jgi:hypothetical protein
MFRRLWIVAALGAAIVVTNACLGSALRVDQTLSPSFADLSTIKSIEVTTQSGDVLLRGSFSEATNSSSKLERTASLTMPDSTTARGTALIEIDRTSGLSEETITVKLDELPYPESCRLMADGRELTIFSTTKGKIEFRLTRRVTLANGRN